MEELEKSLHRIDEGVFDEVIKVIESQNTLVRIRSVLPSTESMIVLGVMLLIYAFV